jgi:hypothetical protein
MNISINLKVIPYQMAGVTQFLKKVILFTENNFSWRLSCKERDGRVQDRRSPSKII